MLPGLTTLFIEPSSGLQSLCNVNEIFLCKKEITTHMVIYRSDADLNYCVLSKEMCHSCMDTTRKRVILQYYYNCVWIVPCTQHEEGYNERLTLLFAIDEELEALRANSGNWWNAGSSLDISLVIMLISLATVFKELIYKAY